MEFQSLADPGPRPLRPPPRPGDGLGAAPRPQVRGDARMGGNAGPAEDPRYGLPRPLPRHGRIERRAHFPPPSSAAGHATPTTSNPPSREKNSNGNSSPSATTTAWTPDPRRIRLHRHPPPAVRPRGGLAFHHRPAGPTGRRQMEIQSLAHPGPRAIRPPPRPGDGLGAAARPQVRRRRRHGRKRCPRRRSPSPTSSAAAMPLSASTAARGRTGRGSDWRRWPPACRWSARTPGAGRR